MNKFIFAILLVCSSVVFSREPSPAIQKMHQSCIYPSVFIMGESSVGSGTIIKSQKVDGREIYVNTVLTCAHVVNDARFYNVITFSYEKWSKLHGYKTNKSIVHYMDTEHDVAILVFCSDRKLECADLDLSGDLFIGDSIIAVGCGLGGLPPRLDQGQVSGIGVHGEYSHRINIFTIPGDSGSAVFYDNKIIGIRRAIRMMPSGSSNVMVPQYTYMVSIDILSELNKNGNLDFAIDRESDIYASLDVLILTLWDAELVEPEPDILDEVPPPPEE